jgi:hypothetical protein
VLKLARSLSGLRQIIETVLASISQIMNLFMILFLVMFIFALLGMEMFRGQYTEDKGFAPMVKSYGGALAPPGAVVPEPYVHFDNFYFSMVTIFVVISGENWNDVYFTGFQASAHPRRRHPLRPSTTTATSTALPPSPQRPPPPPPPPPSSPRAPAPHPNTSTSP